MGYKWNQTQKIVWNKVHFAAGMLGFEGLGADNTMKLDSSSLCQFKQAMLQIREKRVTHCGHIGKRNKLMGLVAPMSI